MSCVVHVPCSTLESNYLVTTIVGSRVITDTLTNDTSSTHRMTNVHVWARVTKLAALTWAARSTRILENAVKLICSDLSFGTSDNPVHFPLSRWYRERRWPQEICFPLHCSNSSTTKDYAVTVGISHIRHNIPTDPDSLRPSNFVSFWSDAGGQRRKVILVYQWHRDLELCGWAL